MVNIKRNTINFLFIYVYIDQLSNLRFIQHMNIKTNEALKVSRNAIGKY